MRKCCVCGNNNLKEDADILFINKNGDYKEICEKCSENMEKIEKNENKKEIRNAISYLESYIEENNDFEAKNYLKNLIDNIDNPPLNSSNNFKSNNYDNTKSDSIWIKGLKTISYMIFVAIIIIGIILGVSSGDLIGFGIFLLSILIAFLSVAWTMTYLDIASDIRHIRNSNIKTIKHK